MDLKAIQTAAVIGAGAMGAVYADRISQALPGRTGFIAGGDRRKRLEEKGVRVNGTPLRLPVIDPDAPGPPVDLLLVAVKHSDLPDAAAQAARCVGPETLLLSLMNGIDSERTIGDAVGREKVLYAVAVGIDAVRDEAGVTYSRLGTLIFGEPENSRISDRVRRVQHLLERAGIPFETPADMIRALWWKFMINVGINQASAILRAPYGVFQASPEARDLMVSSMKEVIDLARAASVDLRESDIEAWLEILSGLSPAGQTSMLQDIEAGRRTEVEMFAGRVVEMGTALEVPTPVNRTLLRIIRSLESMAVGSGGRFNH